MESIPIFTKYVDEVYLSAAKGLAEGVRTSVTSSSQELGSAAQSVLAQMKDSCKTLSEGFSMVVQVGCAICTALEVPGVISPDVTEILEIVLNCFTGMFM